MNVSLELTRMTGTLHEDQYISLIIYRSILLRMRNVSDKSCRENQNTHFMFKNFLPLENCAVYEIMGKNMYELDRPQMTIRRMRIAYWILKTTNTHSTATMVERTLLNITLHYITFLVQSFYFKCLHERLACFHSISISITPTLHTKLQK
jgi:hypothetical protein